MRTPLSSGLAAASMGLLLLGLVLRSWQVLLLALPPIIVLALGSLAPPPRPRIVALRSLSADRTDAGREVDVELVVRNEGPSLDLVEIADVLPREFAVLRGTNHAVVSLEKDGTLRLAYRIRSAVKGDFVLGPVRARSFDPLALGAQDVVLDVRSPLVVAPAMEDLRRAALQPRRTRPWFGQVASRRIGPGTEFWGVREYVAGDEVPHQLEGVRAPRAALHERVRGGALGGRGHRGRRAARVVRGHGGGQSGRTRGPGGPRDRGPRPRDEEPGRPDRVPPGDRLGPARLRTEAALSDLGPPGPREAGLGRARLPRGSRPLAVLPAGLPHRPDYAAAGPGRAHGGD